MRAVVAARAARRAALKPYRKFSHAGDIADTDNVRKASSAQGHISVKDQVRLTLGSLVVLLSDSWSSSWIGHDLGRRVDAVSMSGSG